MRLGVVSRLLVCVAFNIVVMESPLSRQSEMKAHQQLQHWQRSIKITRSETLEPIELMVFALSKRSTQTGSRSWTVGTAVSSVINLGDITATCACHYVGKSASYLNTILVDFINVSSQHMGKLFAKMICDLR